jgi:hypothetical protein
LFDDYSGCLRSRLEPIPATAVPATAIAVPATAIIAIPTEPTTAAAIFTRTGFVHRQIAILKRVAIEAFDRFLRALLCRHLNKPKPFGTACFPIHDQSDLDDLTCLPKERADLIFRRAVRQVANVQLLIHVKLRETKN